jgi:hypothetical protein
MVIASVLIGMLLIISSTLLFLLDVAAAKLNTAHTASSIGTLSGTITCPNGEAASSATIVFGVTQYHDYRDITGTEGNFRLAAQSVGSIDGILTDGHVGEKSFRVTGSETIGGGCRTLNSDMVISGKCGTDVTVLYRAEDKVIGRFTGNVECHTTQA